MKTDYNGKCLMYDGLELGHFESVNNKLELKLNIGIQSTWLPFIFELAYNNGTDMTTAINAWKRERVFPKNRIGKLKMLRQLGLWRYNIDKICEVTRCSLMTDPYWITYTDKDTYSSNTVRGKLNSKRMFPYNSLDLKNEDKYVWRI